MSNNTPCLGSVLLHIIDILHQNYAFRILVANTAQYLVPPSGLCWTAAVSGFK